MLLRKESYGNELSFTHMCANPQCGDPMELTFNLDDLKIHQPKTDQAFPLALPSGAKVVLRPLNGWGERELTRKEGTTEHDLLLKCIESLGGESPSRDRFLKLPGKDMVALRATIKDQFGWVDDVALVRCKECGTVNRISLMTHPGFLYPGM